MAEPGLDQGGLAAENKVAVLVQAGLTRIKALPKVPLLLDLAKNDEQRSIIKFLASGAPLGRSALTTPGVPADRLAALRKALAATVKDPAYLAEAKSRKLSIEPSSVTEVEAAVRQMVGTSPALLGKIKTILGVK